MQRAPTVCVYCGSSFGNSPAFQAAAQHLGAALAKAGMPLVYGGGNLGLMGAIAKSALEHGGHVTGIVPHFLNGQETQLKGLSDLIVTKDMHERKELMFQKSDAFVALPGGIGTLEELAEQLTWVQLRQHAHPIILANISNFWTPLQDLLNHMRDQGFLNKGYDTEMTVVDKPEDIVPAITAELAK